MSKELNDIDFRTILVGGGNNSDEKSIVDFARENGVVCAVIPEMGKEIHFYDDIISLLKLYLLIKKEKPTIVHTHTSKAGAIGRIAAYLAGVR